MNHCTVGVIIPSYNQGMFLEDCIKSVIEQKSLNIKIVVMDGGSTDNSVDIIKKYQDNIFFWCSCKDEGQSAAINEGVRLLDDCKYICWLNSDDFYYKNGLTELVNFLEENDRYVAAYSKAYFTDEAGNVIGEYPTHEYNRDYLAIRCYICQPATLIKKEYWDKVGGVDAKLHMCMDYDLWCKLSQLGELGYLKKVTACSREHGETKTTTNKKMHYMESYSLLKKYYGKIPNVWRKSRFLDLYYYYNKREKWYEKILYYLIDIKYKK